MNVTEVLLFMKKREIPVLPKYWSDIRDQKHKKMSSKSRTSQPAGHCELEIFIDINEESDKEENSKLWKTCKAIKSFIMTIFTFIFIFFGTQEEPKELTPEEVYKETLNAKFDNESDSKFTVKYILEKIGFVLMCLIVPSPLLLAYYVVRFVYRWLKKRQEKAVKLKKYYDAVYEEEEQEPFLEQ